MSAILKRNRTLFEDEAEDGNDQLDERNRCRSCGKFFVRLARHMRNCRQRCDHYSEILNDARRALGAKKRPKLACSGNPRETAVQSGVTEGPGQRSLIEGANDIDVCQNHSKILQKAILIGVM